MISVLVAEDHRSIYELVRTAAKGTDDIEVLGYASTADQVIPAAMKLQPDVVLMNLVMVRRRGDQTPEVCGLDIAKELMADLPGVHVLLYTALKRPELMEQARKIGTSGYLPKDCSITELLDGIRTAGWGGSLWDEVLSN
jgi:DNA-binding NarL/FixJ family response regulator